MSAPHPFDVGDRLPTLDGSRLRLRWLEERDVDALYRIFSDAQVTRYWSSPPLQDRAAAEDLLTEIRDYFAARTLYQWGVARIEDDEVIGTCTLASLSVEHHRAELGCALARDSWRQGVMTEVTPLLLDFAFERLQLHRLDGEADPRNTASLALLERLGFSREGYQRQRFRMYDEWQDAVIYGLLREEWRSR
jgi:ribosomal-protein-alanine N-acetyltransferase